MADDLLELRGVLEYSFRVSRSYGKCPMKVCAGSVRYGSDTLPTEAKYDLLDRFPVPEGFRRVQQTYTLSIDKRTVEFLILDEQIQQQSPNPA